MIENAANDEDEQLQLAKALSLSLDDAHIERPTTALSWTGHDVADGENEQVLPKKIERVESKGRALRRQVQELQNGIPNTPVNISVQKRLYSERS
ncbi:hypothetical protein EDD11_005459 [Mortierella claussenii]|nr:hypothetical protein EDD11_005459 [Mortierella claussenii]